jgi:hypothetical protein
LQSRENSRRNRKCPRGNCDKGTSLLLSQSSEHRRRDNACENYDRDPKVQISARKQCFRVIVCLCFFDTQVLEPNGSMQYVLHVGDILCFDVPLEQPRCGEVECDLQRGRNFTRAGRYALSRTNTRPLYEQLLSSQVYHLLVGSGWVWGSCDSSQAAPLFPRRIAPPPAEVGFTRGKQRHSPRLPLNFRLAAAVARSSRRV